MKIEREEYGVALAAIPGRETEHRAQAGLARGNVDADLLRSCDEMTPVYETLRAF